MASSDVLDIYGRIENTATDFINGYVDAHKAQDISILSARCTPSCRRYLAPASFLKQAPHLSAGWSNAEYETRMRPEMEGYSSVQVEIKSIVVDSRKRQAVVQSLHFNTMATDGRTWEFEFMFVLSCNDSGLEIENIVEFVDTATVGEMVMAYDEMRLGS